MGQNRIWRLVALCGGRWAIYTDIESYLTEYISRIFDSVFSQGLGNNSGLQKICSMLSKYIIESPMQMSRVR